MIITGFNRISLVNYDTEISATIFLGGCNYRCPFCHNFQFVVKGDEEIEEIPKEEVLEYLEKRKHLLSAVVITGGEPTLSPDLKEFIKEIKNRSNLKVKLDSNGSRPEVIKDLFNEKLIDYVAIDIKNSLDMYSVTVGVSGFKTDGIEETVRFLLNSEYDYEFRTTIMKPFHTKESIERMSSWIKGAKRMFLQKFEMTSNVPSRDLSEVSKEEANEFVSVLKKNINVVSLRGYEE